MSVKTQGDAWELNLPPNEKYLLIALADHADHNGKNAFPGVELLAAKTGYSERSVRRILESLEEKAVIIQTHRGSGQGNFDAYSIDVKAVELSPYFAQRKAVKMSGLSNKQSGQDVRFPHINKADICDSTKRTSATSKADICDSAHDKERARVLTIHEPSMNTHTQQQPVRVCVESENSKTGSRFSAHECRQYAEHLKATGSGITNPGGYATIIHRSGEADSLIEEFLNPAKAIDVNKCPDCEGRGMYYPNGIGIGPVVKCRHEKLKAATATR